MRNYLADYNLLAVSANLKEPALNTEQELDTSLLVAKSAVIGLEYRRENNADELTGKEEPDTVYDLGALSAASLSFEKAQAQHFALGYAYALGGASSAAWGSGFRHTVTPTTDMELPGMTAAMRLGQTIMKRRFASLFVDTLKATFAKDSWAKLELGVKGTGKHTDNMVNEQVTAPYNATTLTLAANGVQGATAAARLDSVHAVRCLVPTTGEYVDVAVTGVSGASPAVITFTAPGGVATATIYEILYVPIEPSWCAFPPRVSEPPLRVSDLVVKLGGRWNGTVFLGGHEMSAEINSIEHSISNQMAIEYRIGGSGSYASYAMRMGRQQTLALNRQARDFILQQKVKANEYFGVQLQATGAAFETGKNYSVDIVFPRCAVLKAPLSVDGKVLAEAGDLTVLQDDVYGSVRVVVGNKVAQYAA